MCCSVRSPCTGLPTVSSSVAEACKRSIKQTEKVAPKAKSAALYDRHYAVYTKLYPDLQARFPEMAALA